MQFSDRIGQRIKLHDLHVLITVVQAGSMNKAASFLNTTQPAVSKSIKELERTVGVRLLERSAQGVEPTLYGRALLNGGTAVFDDLRLAVKNIESLTDPQAGEVRIGCGSWLAPCFVAAIIEQLARRYPRIEFRIVTPPLEMLRRELHERRVDVLIEARLAPHDELSDFELLYEENQIIATGVNNPWARRRRVKLSDLAHESWVLAPPESVFGFLLREDFQAAGFDFPPTTVFTEYSGCTDSLVGERALSDDAAGIGASIFAQTPSYQGIAGPAAEGACSSRTGYPEEAHAQPSR